MKVVTFADDILLFFPAHIVDIVRWLGLRSDGPVYVCMCRFWFLFKQKCFAEGLIDFYFNEFGCFCFVDPFVWYVNYPHWLNVLQLKHCWCLCWRDFWRFLLIRVYTDTMLSERNTLPVIKEAVSCLFLVVSYADGAAEPLKRSTEGNMAGRPLSALLPYVFPAPSNSSSCAFQSIFPSSSLSDTFKAWEGSVLGGSSICGFVGRVGFWTSVNRDVSKDFHLHWFRVVLRCLVLL